MTTHEPPDILRQVLEIVDMFADENAEMCSDMLRIKHARYVRDLDSWASNEIRLYLKNRTIVQTACMVGAAIQERAATLKQALEIVDLFEQENILMVSDILQRKPAARRLVRAGIRPNAEEFAELCGANGLVHIETASAAATIGAAIRERFGLPAKKGEDPA